MITLNNVTGGYNNRTRVVENISFKIEKGKFFALLGPNGSGKTTIIRLIMGVLQLHEGSISIEGKKTEAYKPKELAKKVAVLSQENEAGLDFTVQEIVELGRYPYQKSSLFREYTPDDEKVVERVMKQTNSWEFRNKLFTSLSGGEKQRVLLAKALAQEPDILLLDEPTNHLDVRHTIELLDLLKSLQMDCNLTILAILHDLNLASLYADEIGLLQKGKLVGLFDGLSMEVQQLFSDVYGVPMQFSSHPQIPKYQVFFTPDIPTEERTPSLIDCISVQVNKKDWIVAFTKPFRTLTVGTAGKGLTWENSWNTPYGTEAPISFEGKTYMFVYNQELKQCLELDWDKEFIQEWTYILIVSEQGNQRRIGLLAAADWDDTMLMNIAMKMTAQITELWIDKRNHHYDIELLAISTCRSMDGSKQERQSFREIEMLIRYGAQYFFGTGEVRLST